MFYKYEVLQRLGSGILNSHGLQKQGRVDSKISFRREKTVENWRTVLSSIWVLPHADVSKMWTDFNFSEEPQF